MNLFFISLTWLGSALLLWRLWPRPSKPSAGLSDSFRYPKVSLIVPARNEEHNLSRLLSSLKRLDYPDYEIIVIDDHSTDQTRAVAGSFGVRVLASGALPDGWNGKNWACHQAAKSATGDMLLFTDADTEHHPDSLKRAVSFFTASEADMVSALPYHRTEQPWEKLLGPFHALLLASTAPYASKPRRLFAIGQYLMFSRASYEKQGGHAAVFNQYPDDLALANACLRSGGRYRLSTENPFYQVRMYPTLREFIQGWRRNFLAGIQQSNWQTTLDVVLMFIALAGAGRPFSSISAFLPMAVAVLFILQRQKAWGRFSFWGPLLAPFSLALFLGITVLAIVDKLTGNRLTWKGRSYTGWVENRSAQR